jgi:hypothetical protein
VAPGCKILSEHVEVSDELRTADRTPERKSPAYFAAMTVF